MNSLTSSRSLVKGKKIDLNLSENMKFGDQTEYLELTYENGQLNYIVFKLDPQICAFCNKV